MGPFRYSKSALSVVLLSFASFRSDNEFIEPFTKINDEVLKNSRAYETLSEASSSIGHRLTGSANGQKA